jgi:hypothetical protein
VEKVGFDKAASLYRTYGRAVDLIQKLVAEEGIHCAFARPGKLILASKAAHFQGSEKTAELLNSRLGVETHLVPKSELRREIGSDAFHGGMVDSKSASLHVGKYIRGLGEAAERAGVTIHEDAPVLKVTKLGSGHELETSRGRIQADQVLLATAPTPAGRSAGTRSASHRSAASSSPPNRSTRACATTCCPRDGWPQPRARSECPSSRRFASRIHPVVLSLPSREVEHFQRGLLVGELPSAAAPADDAKLPFVLRAPSPGMPGSGAPSAWKAPRAHHRVRR